MDGTIEARPEWKDLLDRVRQGETLTLTEGGRPVAKLAPAGASSARSDAEVERIKQAFEDFRARHTLDGISWKELRDEGRR
jgi:prevent-host-death family protein